MCKLNVSSEALNITGLDSGYSTVFPKPFNNIKLE